VPSEQKPAVIVDDDGADLGQRQQSRPVDRLTAGAHALIVEGPSYRQRNRPNQHAGIDSASEAHDAH
jgi:hypothetical protein